MELPLTLANRVRNAAGAAPALRTVNGGEASSPGSVPYSGAFDASTACSRGLIPWPPPRRSLSTSPRCRARRRGRVVGQVLLIYFVGVESDSMRGSSHRRGHQGLVELRDEVAKTR